MIKIQILPILNRNEVSLKNYQNREIELNKLTIVTGLNGCGKTHLLNYLNRIKLNYQNEEINYIQYNWNAEIRQEIARNNQQITELDIEQRYDNELNSLNIEIRNYKQLFIQGKTEEEILRNLSILRKLKKIYGDDKFYGIIEKGYTEYCPPEINENIKEWGNFIKFFFKWKRAKDKNVLETVEKNPIEAQQISKQKTPINIINELFEKYNFQYRLDTLKVNPMSISFKDLLGNNIQLQELSSGEKMIVSLIMWVHNTNSLKKVKCLLLDEPDAHLHPSLSKMFMDIVYEKFVKEYGIQVIIATHSPSTIAYTPENEDVDILFMDKEKNIIEKVEKEIAIEKLSSGLMLVKQNTIELSLEDTISNTAKPILCIEGITDKMIITTAWNNLKGHQEMPFTLCPMFDCYFISNLFKREKIFDNYPNTLFIGLLDYDEALKNLREKLKEKKTSYEKRGCVWKHKSGKGYIFPLPVPESRKNEAGEDIRDSYLSIEKYFSNDIIESFCEKQKIAMGGEILVFKDDKKTEFARLTRSFDKDKFNNFTVLFDMIDSIIQDYKKPSRT